MEALLSAVPGLPDLQLVVQRLDIVSDDLRGETREARINALVDHVISRGMVSELVAALQDRRGNTIIADLDNLDLDHQRGVAGTGVLGLDLYRESVRVLIGSSACIAVRVHNYDAVAHRLTFIAHNVDQRWLHAVPSPIDMPPRSEAPANLCFSIPATERLRPDLRKLVVEARCTDDDASIRQPLTLEMVALEFSVDVPVLNVSGSGSVTITNASHVWIEFELRVTTDSPSVTVSLAETRLVVQPQWNDDGESGVVRLVLAGDVSRPKVAWDSQSLGTYAIEAVGSHEAARAEFTEENAIVVSPYVDLRWAIFWFVLLVAFPLMVVMCS